MLLTTIHINRNHMPMTNSTSPSGPGLDTLLTVLADPTRRGVVEELSLGPRRAGELARALDVSPPAMSRHLRLLLEANVVMDERGRSDARARVFRLRPNATTALEAWLDQLAAHWQEQLHAFKEHVESPHGPATGGRP